MVLAGQLLGEGPAAGPTGYAMRVNSWELCAPPYGRTISSGLRLCRRQERHACEKRRGFQEQRMKRRSVTILLSFAFLLAVGACAFAGDKSAKIAAYIDSTNAEIDEMINAAMVEANEIVASGGDLSSIIQELLSDTNKAAAWAIKKSKGSAVCTLIEVLIGGQAVTIDPLKVLNRGSQPRRTPRSRRKLFWGDDGRPAAEHARQVPGKSLEAR
jgi:hypothetical protein